MYNITISEWCGGLGNNLHQISHAIHFAKETKSILTYPHHPLITQKTFDFSDGVAPTKTLSSPFFYMDDINWDEYNMTFDMTAILQTYILPVFPSYTPMNIDFDLVVHIRGGDIIPDSSYSSYDLFIQSPLSYFQKIFSIEYPKNILIVAQDKKNPMVDALLHSQYNCTYVQRKRREDVNYILNCKTLVIGGVTSFSNRLSQMSPHIKKVYVPVYEGENLPKNTAHSDKNTADNAIHYAQYIPLFHRNYIPCLNWKYDASQQKLMQHHAIKNIFFLSEISNTKIAQLERAGKMRAYIFSKKFRITTTKACIKNISSKKWWTDKVKYLFYTNKFIIFIANIKKHNTKR